MSGDGFLSRWSRRKRAVEAAERSSVTGEARAAPETPPGDDKAAAEAAPDPEAITPEELAALPAIETIDASTDVTAFLRKGVPAVLRNAALRRAWATDPVIRDFVNDARDYALDWNTPGGAPGYGPLTESDDVKEMVARIFGDPPAPRDSLPQGQQGDPASTPAEITADAASQQEEAQGDAALPRERSLPASDVTPSLRLSSHEKLPENVEISSQSPQNTGPDREFRRANKRHGGAFPV